MATKKTSATLQYDASDGTLDVLVDGKTVGKLRVSGRRPR